MYYYYIGTENICVNFVLKVSVSHKFNLWWPLFSAASTFVVRFWSLVRKVKNLLPGSFSIYVSNEICSPVHSPIGNGNNCLSKTDQHFISIGSQFYKSKESDLNMNTKIFETLSGFNKIVGHHRRVLETKRSHSNVESIKEHPIPQHIRARHKQRPGHFITA